MHAKFELWSVLVPDINLRSFFVETTLGLFYSFYHNWYQNIQNSESDVFLPSMNKQMKLLMQVTYRWLWELNWLIWYYLKCLCYLDHSINPLQPGVAFLYPLKTSFKLKVFCLQEVWKSNTGLQWVKTYQNLNYCHDHGACVVAKEDICLCRSQSKFD